MIASRYVARRIRNAQRCKVSGLSLHVLTPSRMEVCEATLHPALAEPEAMFARGDLKSRQEGGGLHAIELTAPT